MLHLEDATQHCQIVQVALRRMWPASYAQCTTTIETVSLMEIRSLVHSARQQRFDAARTLLGNFLRTGTEPYLPVSLTTSPVPKLIIPPVVEAHPGYFSLVDGIHRTLAAHRSRLRYLKIIVIAGDAIPAPPGDLCTLEEISLTSSPRTPSELFRNLDYSRFKPLGYGHALETEVRRVLEEPK